MIRLFVGTLRNAGLSCPSPWAVVPAFGNSSFVITIVSFLDWIVTGTISLSKYPAVIAASAFCCDFAAYSSWSSRVIMKFLAIFSAEK